MMRPKLSRAAGLVLAGMLAWTGATAGAADAEAVIKETTEKVLEALRSEGDGLKTHPERLYKLVDELILPRFDFRQMSQWVLGRHWRTASPAQRDAFIKQFQALLVRTYSQALVDYRNQEVEFLPSRERSPDEVTVRAQIDPGGGPPIPINYEMRLTDGGWKVHDVAIEGVSLVITYRSSFSQEIQRSGIDGLIQRLAEKSRAESG